MNYTQEADVSSKYAAAQQAQGYGGLVGAVSPRPDGLTSCLGRIQALLNELVGNGYRLHSIADNIGGQEPEKISGGAQPPENPVPSIPLFMARQIEAVLQDQIASQSSCMNRIERSIS